MSDSSGKSWRDSATDFIGEWVPDSVVEVGNDLEDRVFEETGYFGEAIVEDIDRIDWSESFEENQIRVERLLTLLDPMFKSAVYEWSKSGKTKGRQLNKYWNVPAELARFANTKIEKKLFRLFVEMTSKGDATYFKAWNTHAVALINRVIEEGAGDLGAVDSVKSVLGMDLDEETLQRRARDEFIQKERVFVGMDLGIGFESIKENSAHYSESLAEAFYQLAKSTKIEKQFTLDEFFDALKAFVSKDGLDAKALSSLKKVKEEDGVKLLCFMNSLLLDARIDLEAEGDEELSEEEVLEREIKRFGPGLSSLLMVLGFVGMAGVIRHKFRKWRGKDTQPMFAWLSGAVSLASFGALAGEDKMVDSLEKNGVYVSGQSILDAGRKAAQFDFKGARDALMSPKLSEHEAAAAKEMKVRSEVLANYLGANYASLLAAESGVQSFVEDALVDGVEMSGVDLDSIFVNMIPGVNHLQFIKGREKIAEYLSEKIQSSELDVADAKKMSIKDLLTYFKSKE